MKTTLWLPQHATYLKNAQYVDFEGETYACLITHTSSLLFDSDYLIAVPRWSRIRIKRIAAWSPHTLYAEGDPVLFGFVAFECLAKHRSGADFIQDYTDAAQVDAEGYSALWMPLYTRAVHIPEYFRNKPLIATYIAVMDECLLHQVDLPMVQLSQIRKLGVNVDADILTKTGKMLGLDLSKYLKGAPNTLIEYTPYLTQCKAELGVVSSFSFMNFLLQNIVGSALDYAIKQLWTKNYFQFFASGAVMYDGVVLNTAASSPQLYVNMPSTFYRATARNIGAKPSNFLKWTSYNGTLADKNISIAVERNDIKDENSGTSLKSDTAVAVVDERMIFEEVTTNFSDAVAPNIQVFNTYLNGMGDFTIDLTFRIDHWHVNDPLEVGIQTLFHFGNGGATPNNDELTVYVSRDGSVSLIVRSGTPVVLYPAGTIRTKTFYDLSIVREINYIRGFLMSDVEYITGKRSSYIAYAPTLQILSGVLGQHASGTYTGFSYLKSFVGELKYFRVTKPTSRVVYRGVWDNWETYAVNDVVVIDDGALFYPSSHYTYGPSDGTSVPYAQRELVREIFNDFMPATAVLYEPEPDDIFVLSSFPIMVAVEAEFCEIEECVPFEYLCPIPYDTQGSRLIVPFK